MRSRRTVVVLVASICAVSELLFFNGVHMRSRRTVVVLVASICAVGELLLF